MINLEKLVNDVMKHKYVHGFAMHVSHDHQHIQVAKGNLEGNKRFFAASVTKLLVTTIMLQLVEENQLRLEDFIVSYLRDMLPS